MTIVRDVSLRNLIKRHEGEVVENDRHMPYTDSVGKLTIGYGRNLTDRGLSQDEAEYLLQNDVFETLTELRNTFPWYIHLSQNRQFALCDMCFNMGLTKLLTFKKMLAAFEAKDYEEAARQAEDSKWYKQVGSRGRTVVTLIREG